MRIGLAAATLLASATVASPQTQDVQTTNKWGRVECDPDNGGLTLPPGFCALVVAENVGRARHIAVRRNGDIYVAINGNDVATAFMIPVSPQGRRWRRVVDTSLPSPDDIVAEDKGKVITEGNRYPVGPFSVVILVTEG